MLRKHFPTLGTRAPGAVRHITYSCMLILSLDVIPVSATPVGWSAFDLGGHSVIEDPLGNQYLSPTATLGLSFDAALTSTWVADLGFAPTSDLSGLLTAYGLPTTTSPDVNSNGFDSADLVSGFGEPAKNFVIDFGITQDSSPSGPDTFVLTRGWLAPVSGSNVGRAFVAHSNFSGTDRGGVLVQADTGSGANTVSIFTGTWLTRGTATVPEPATGGILLLALMVLGAVSAGRTRYR